MDLDRAIKECNALIDEAQREIEENERDVMPNERAGLLWLGRRIGVQEVRSKLEAMQAE